MGKRNTLKIHSKEGSKASLTTDYSLYLKYSRVALKRRRAEKNRLAAAEYSKVCIRGSSFVNFNRMGGGWYIWAM